METYFIPNSAQDKTGLHPNQTLARVEPIRDPVEAVNHFRETLTSEPLEIDVGDWKRDVTAAIYQLGDDLAGHGYWVFRTVEHMKALLNWTYRQDTDHLTQELLKRADGIVRGLEKEARRERMGHKLA